MCYSWDDAYLQQWALLIDGMNFVSRKDAKTQRIVV
jgi:hypothetical protein